MAEGKIRVKFEAKNAPELIAAVKALNQQTKRLGLETKKTTTKTKELNVTQERQHRNTKVLSNSIFGMGGMLSSIRAKFLLYAFAIRQATQFIGGFIKEAQAFDGVRRSFDQLAFSTDLSSDSFEKLSDATNNTVSSLDIMKQANIAMLLGIADSTEQMAEMFEISHKLAKAVGKDATFGMESLTTGIGRQSRLMLDNLGIIVIAEKAYKKHADALNKNTSELTDAEKKQAFLNEAMLQAREMASLLPAPVDDVTDKYNQLSAALVDAKIAFSQAFTVGIAPALDALILLSDLMTPERIKAYLTMLTSVGVAMAIYYRNTQKAVIWQTRLGWGALATVAGELTLALFKLSGVFSEADDSIEKGDVAVIKYLKSLKSMNTDILKNEKVQLENANAALRSSDAYIQLSGDSNTARESITDLTTKIAEAIKNQAGDAVVKKLQGELKVAQSIRDNLDQTNNSERQSIAINNKKIKTIDEYIAILAESGLTVDQFNDAQTKLNGLWKKTDEGQRQSVERNIEWVEGLKKAFGHTKEFNDVLEMLKNQLKDLDEEITPLKEKFEEIFKVDPDVLQVQIDAFSNMSSAISANIDARMNHELEALRATDAFKKASTDRQKKMEEDKTAEFTRLRKNAWRAEKASNLASAGMNISLAYTKALAQGGGLFGIPLASLVAALGAVQLIAIASTPMPKFAQGGLIGGKRHSSGGTNINAESGEFVMSRNAVSSIGVENLNRMNQGASGGGGSVTVNINGGLITPEFVENDLAEAIREGARRGADFGVSDHIHYSPPNGGRTTGVIGNMS